MYRYTKRFKITKGDEFKKNLNEKKIIFTGSSGFLGSIIYSKLKKKYNLVRYKNNDNIFSNKKNNFAILHLAALDQKSSQENPLLANEINSKLTKKF